ncbi:CDP-alcohol phosphatidyltransferase family protein [Singulisphaera rosea]
MRRVILRKSPRALVIGVDGAFEEPRYSRPVQRFLAWCVHLYTASGLVIAALISVLLVRGGTDAYRSSFFLMLLATVIDATDGTFARRIGVKKVLPNFDGRKLDDLTDFLTYTFLPLLLIWRAGILPTGQEAWLLFPLLASAYGFCQVEAKTEDGYFLGFPSLWNVVAFYLYVLHLPEWTSLGVVVTLSLLTFVPSRYLYPSQPGLLNVLSNILGVVWACLLAGILWQLRREHSASANELARTLALTSLFYPAFYMATSWVITLNRWQRRLLHPRHLG